MVPNWTVAWFKANEMVPFIFLALAHPALQRQDSNPINPTQQIIVTTQMVHCKSNSLRDIHHSAWQTSSQGNYICINCKSSTTSQPNLFNARVPFWCQLATSMLGSTHALAFRLCELSQGLGSRPKQLKKSNIPQYEDSHKKHPGWSEESHQENEVKILIWRIYNLFARLLYLQEMLSQLHCTSLKVLKMFPHTWDKLLPLSRLLLKLTFLKCLQLFWETEIALMLSDANAEWWCLQMLRHSYIIYIPFLCLQGFWGKRGSLFHLRECRRIFNTV